MTMRVGAVLLMMLWAGCALAEGRLFQLIGTSGKRYSAIAKRLQIWVEDGVVHGVAEVRVQDAPGRPVVWEFQFTGCERGSGAASSNTRTATTDQPVHQEGYWIYRASDFPSNFIAPLCDLTKPEWLHLVRSSTKS